MSKRQRRMVVLAAVQAALLAGSAVACAGEVGAVRPASGDDNVTNTRAAPGDARQRVPWTGSRFAGTPDPPPPYTVALAFPKLKLRIPRRARSGPGDKPALRGRAEGPNLLVPERPGLRQGRPGARSRQGRIPTFRRSTAWSFIQQFDKTRYVYVCYVLKNDAPDGSVVSRFTVSRTDPPVIDPESEQVILTFWSGGP